VFKKAGQRADAELRRRLLFRETADNAKRLQAADAAVDEGDIRLATLIYLHIANSRPQNKLTLAARQRLDALGIDARQKLSEFESLLASKENLVQSYDQFEDFVEQYELVPVIGPQIKERLANQQNAAKFVSVLREDEARKLWDMGQAFEQKDEMCCAFLAYEQGEKLKPAASAILAKNRLAKLKEDPTVVAAAATCRELRWCHDAYRRAEELAKKSPEAAKQLFAEIVRRAPGESEVLQAARKRLE
jgi:hypothetical protein